MGVTLSIRLSYKWSWKDILCELSFEVQFSLINVFEEVDLV